MKSKSISLILLIIALIAGLTVLNNMEEKQAKKFLNSNYTIKNIESLSGEEKELDSNIKTWIYDIVDKSRKRPDGPEKGELHQFIYVNFEETDKYVMAVKVDTIRNKIYISLYIRGRSPVLKLVYTESHSNIMYENWSSMIKRAKE